MVLGLQLEQLWSGEVTGRFKTVLQRLKQFCKHCVAETHANKVVGVVVFLGGKVVEVCRVLVLSGQVKGARGEAHWSSV